MEVVHFYQLMENPSLLNETTLSELSQIVRDYPYFHAARMLYLKNLAVLHDARFAGELKKTVAYISDKRRLYMLIEDVRAVADVAITLADSKEDPFVRIDKFLDALNRDAQMTLPVLSSATSDYLQWAKEKGAEGNDATPPLRHYELIDSFLNEAEQKVGHRLRFAEDDSDTSDESGDAPLQDTNGEVLGDSCFTETLAKVYVKQKRYDKALEIIQQLRVKYPEKNVFFADQIEFLEKLITHIKK